MSASLDRVQVVFLDKISISPDVKAVNLSLALSGVNLTLLASPSTAAATALHTSTVSYTHLTLPTKRIV